MPVSNDELFEEIEYVPPKPVGISPLVYEALDGNGSSKGEETPSEFLDRYIKTLGVEFVMRWKLKF